MTIHISENFSLSRLHPDIRMNDFLRSGIFIYFISCHNCWDNYCADASPGKNIDIGSQLLLLEFIRRSFPFLMRF